MAVIENSFGGGDKVVGVLVTNTGTLALWVTNGSTSFILCQGHTWSLDCCTSTYKVKASDDYKPSSDDGPPPSQDVESKMTTISEITYPSNTLISITGGDTLTGAKFSTTVPMVDVESTSADENYDSDSESDDSKSAAKK